jgi:hypothetical protein
MDYLIAMAVGYVAGATTIALVMVSDKFWDKRS